MRTYNHGDKTIQITSSTRRTAVRLGAVLLGLAAIAAPSASAWAQAAYPAKPIRLIVPFPPGGGTDMIARAVAQKMADQNKWNVIVDNRPGAGGNLGWTLPPRPSLTATPW